MNIDDIQSRPAVASAEFACARHGVRAGAVHLHGDGDDWVVVVDSFLSMTSRVGADLAAEVREALEDRDVRKLYRLDLEYVPFYCPECAAAYCSECWRTFNVFDDEMPGWFEETRGTCPFGHERMLMD